MSSILDTFYILFEADTSKLKKGYGDAKQSADKFAGSLGTIDKLGNHIVGNLANTIKQFGAAAVAAFSVQGIFSLIKGSVELSEQLTLMSHELRTNVTDLDLWGRLVKTTGGGLSTFAATSKQLIKNDYFQILGKRLIGAKQKITDVTTVLPRLSELFERLGKEKSQKLGEKLGLDQATIDLLQRGRRELDDLIKRQKELGLITKQDTELAHKFNIQWQDISLAFRSLALIANSYIFPILTKIGKIFENVANYFRKHSDLIKGGLLAISGVLTYALIPAMLRLLVVSAPFLLWGLLIAGIIGLFAILYEDIKAFYNGQNSLLGDLIKKWPLLGKIVKEIEKFIKALPAIFEQVKVGLVGIWNTLVGFFNFLAGATEKLWSIVKSAFDFMKPILGVGDIDINKSINEVKQVLISAATTPITSTNSGTAGLTNNNSNKTTNISTGDINVQTQATSPYDVGEVLRKVLNVQNRQAINNFDDGVLI